MKKIAFITAALFLLLGAYAQQPKREIIVNPLLIEKIGADKVNELRMTNPRQLIIENIELTHFCSLVAKLGEPDETYKMMGELKNFVKEGKTCDYQDIINNGYIDRYDFQIQSHPTLTTIYTLGNTGYYLFVQSEEWMEEHKRAVIADYGL
jgi:hypothetical protein